MTISATPPPRNTWMIRSINNTSLVTAAALFLIGTKKGTLWCERFRRYRFKWDVTLPNAMGLLAAIAISSLWIVLMRNHSAVHTAFLPRLYFLFYFCAVLMVLSSTDADRLATDQGAI